jgi:hypothetical protein
MPKSQRSKSLLSLAGFISAITMTAISVSSLNSQVWASNGVSRINDDETPTPTATATTPTVAKVCEPPSTLLQIMPFGDMYIQGYYSNPLEGDYFSEMGGFRGYLELTMKRDGFNFDFTGNKRNKGFQGPQDQDHYAWPFKTLQGIANEGIGNMQFLIQEYKRPNIVLFMAGIGDIVANYNYSQMQPELNRIFDGIVANLNNPTIIIANNPPMSHPSVKLQQTIVLYNQVVRDVVNDQRAKGRKIVLVDVASEITDKNFDNPYYPSEAQWEKIASLFHAGICQVAGSAATTTTPTPTITPTATSTPSQRFVYVSNILNNQPGEPTETPTITPTPTATSIPGTATRTPTATKKP